jgi:hypothetical protein
MRALTAEIGQLIEMKEIKPLGVEYGDIKSHVGRLYLFFFLNHNRFHMHFKYVRSTLFGMVLSSIDRSWDNDLVIKKDKVLAKPLHNSFVIMFYARRRCTDGSQYIILCRQWPNLYFTIHLSKDNLKFVISYNIRRKHYFVKSQSFSVAMLRANDWYFYALRGLYAKYELFVNGARQAISRQSTMALRQSSDCSLVGYRFLGELSSIVVYDKWISQSQIRIRYEEGTVCCSSTFQLYHVDKLSYCRISRHSLSCMHASTK